MVVVVAVVVVVVVVAVSPTEISSTLSIIPLVLLHYTDNVLALII